MRKLSFRVWYSEIAVLSAIALLAFYVSGCGRALSTPEQMEKFERAGLIETQHNVVANRQPGNRVGPYRVTPGDILEFQMPAVLRVISSDMPEWLKPVYGRSDVESYLARVSPEGNITLPIVGQIYVADKTLAEIEASVVDSYYPKYVVNSPMIVCEVKKYRNEHERIFTVMGLVNKSNAFPYPPDVQYNLMEALAHAGGLDMVADPRYVQIFRQDASGEIVSCSFSVKKKSLKKTYAVAVKPGDVVYVGHTLRTRMNKFMAEVFHITVGSNTSLTD